jgi:hypothetical protein
MFALGRPLIMHRILSANQTRRIPFLQNEHVRARESLAMSERRLSVAPSFLCLGCYDSTVQSEDNIQANCPFGGCIAIVSPCRILA